MDPYNPYSPPAAPFDSFGFETKRLAYRPARGMAFKWLYLGVCLPLFVVGLPIHFTVSPSNVPLVNAMLTVARSALTLGRITLICAWIYTAWSAIPDDERRGTTPGKAFGMLFVPFYNLFWMFAISGALCDVLNLKLARIGSTPLAPKGLGFLGCIVSLAANIASIPGAASIGPFIAVIANGIWFTYMLECDKARSILARIDLQD